MIDIERPDSDYPDYKRRMEWELWDDDGRDLLEEDDMNEDEFDEMVESYLEDDDDLIEEEYLF